MSFFVLYDTLISHSRLYPDVSPLLKVSKPLFLFRPRSPSPTTNRVNQPTSASRAERGRSLQFSDGSNSFKGEFWLNAAAVG